MPRLALPSALHPSLAFRFMVTWTHLPGAFVFARAASQPKINNNPIKIDYGNTSFHVKGKTDWEPITLRCYQFEGLTRTQLAIYMGIQHFAILGKDAGPALNMGMMQLHILNPKSIPVGVWSIINPWIEAYDFGEADWGSEDVMEVSLTVRYDFAQFVGL